MVGELEPLDRKPNIRMCHLASSGQVVCPFLKKYRKGHRINSLTSNACSFIKKALSNPAKSRSRSGISQYCMWIIYGANRENAVPHGIMYPSGIAPVVPEMSQLPCQPFLRRRSISLLLRQPPAPDSINVLDRITSA